MLGVEAIRTAHAKFGKKPLTREQVRWGLEGLDLTADRTKHLGFEGVRNHPRDRASKLQTPFALSADGNGRRRSIGVLLPRSGPS
jgi:hypothetical protein